VKAELPDGVETTAGIVVATLVAQATIQAAGALLPLEWRIKLRWPFRIAVTSLLVPGLLFDATSGFRWPNVDWVYPMVIALSLAPAILTGPLSLALIANKSRWAPALLFGAAILTALTPWQLWSWIRAVN
jgi:hypothetical protein